MRHFLSCGPSAMQRQSIKYCSLMHQVFPPTRALKSARSNSRRTNLIQIWRDKVPPPRPKSVYAFTLIPHAHLVIKCNEGESLYSAIYSTAPRRKFSTTWGMQLRSFPAPSGSICSWKALLDAIRMCLGGAKRSAQATFLTLRGKGQGVNARANEALCCGLRAWCHPAQSQSQEWYAFGNSHNHAF